jgi:hypothetical protein
MELHLFLGAVNVVLLFLPRMRHILREAMHDCFYFIHTQPLAHKYKSKKNCFGLLRGCLDEKIVLLEN